MKPKVLISRTLSPRAVEIFKQRGVEVEQKAGLKPEDLTAIINQFDGLAIRSSTKVTPAIILGREQAQGGRTRGHRGG